MEHGDITKDKHFLPKSFVDFNVKSKVRDYALYIYNFGKNKRSKLNQKGGCCFFDFDVVCLSSVLINTLNSFFYLPLFSRMRSGDR